MLCGFTCVFFLIQSDVFVCLLLFELFYLPMVISYCIMPAKSRGIRTFHLLTEREARQSQAGADSERSRQYAPLVISGDLGRPAAYPAHEL